MHNYVRVNVRVNATAVVGVCFEELADMWSPRSYRLAQSRVDIAHGSFAQLINKMPGSWR